jgi:hypothetical protein
MSTGGQVSRLRFCCFFHLLFCLEFSRLSHLPHVSVSETKKFKLVGRTKLASINNFLNGVSYRLTTTRSLLVLAIVVYVDRFDVAKTLVFPHHCIPSSFSLIPLTCPAISISGGRAGLNTLKSL